MKANLIKFLTPNFVQAEIKSGDSIVNVSVPLDSLDSYELDTLCKAFRDECFKKAKLRDPKAE